MLIRFSKRFLSDLIRVGAQGVFGCALIAGDGSRVTVVA
jgi:hypothetical protein